MEPETLRQLYSTDYGAWLQQAAQHLRSGEGSQLDAEQIADELEERLRDELDAAHRQNARTIETLLRYRYGSGSTDTPTEILVTTEQEILRACLELGEAFDAFLRQHMEKAYSLALKRFERQEGSQRQAPDTCPWSLEQIAGWADIATASD